MFSTITLKNFRTHTDTTLELHGITVLIGSNNAGKTNLLAGLMHFAKLIARGRPSLGHSQIAVANRDTGLRTAPPDTEPSSAVATDTDVRRLKSSDFFPHRHRLADPSSPMSFSCTYIHKRGRIQYSIDLYETTEFSDHVGCRELLTVTDDTLNSSPQEFRVGWERPIDYIGLNSHLVITLAGTLPPDTVLLIRSFFRDLTSCYGYNFQPTFLKGEFPRPINSKAFRIAHDLGYEGSNLQTLLPLIQAAEPRLFSQFLLNLRRFETSFQGIVADDKNKSKVLWQFDLGRVPARTEEFPPHVVSEGLLRAAAIALLCSMRRPPTLILLEEIENGISQRNLGRFLAWLREAAAPRQGDTNAFRTQIVVTTHSPSVLREFMHSLDCVYHVRLHKRGFMSVVRNLNDSLGVYIDMGSASGDFEMTDDGKRIVHIPPDELLRLWYSGAIAGDD